MLSKMSNICTSCSARGSSSAGKLYVCPSFMGHGDPPNTLCDACVDCAFAPSAGAWAPGATPHFRCNVCVALDAADHRAARIDMYTARFDPTSVRKDTFAAHPGMADLSRASPEEPRSALLRAKKHLAPANTSGLEDVLGHGSDVPSEGTSLLSTTAQFPGAGASTERAARESVARIRRT